MGTAFGVPKMTSYPLVGKLSQGVAKDDQFSGNRKVFASSGLPKVTNFRV